MKPESIMVMTIEPFDHGYAWTMTMDGDVVGGGTSAAEHICFLDARELLKEVRGHFT